MRLASWTIALAVAACVAGSILPGAASAQAVAPQPAPPAQQAAPPDKIGPPLHAKEPPTAKIRRPETTGAEPRELKPSHGDAASQDAEHAPTR